jgi:hypothetical protein
VKAHSHLLHTGVAGVCNYYFVFETDVEEKGRRIRIVKGK